MKTPRYLPSSFSMRFLCLFILLSPIGGLAEGNPGWKVVWSQDLKTLGYQPAPEGLISAPERTMGIDYFDDHTGVFWFVARVGNLSLVSRQLENSSNIELRAVLLDTSSGKKILESRWPTFPYGSELKVIGGKGIALLTANNVLRWCTINLKLLECNETVILEGGTGDVRWRMNVVGTSERLALSRVLEDGTILVRVYDPRSLTMLWQRTFSGITQHISVSDQGVASVSKTDPHKIVFTPLDRSPSLSWDAGEQMAPSPVFLDNSRLLVPTGSELVELDIPKRGLLRNGYAKKEALSSLAVSGNGDFVGLYLTRQRANPLDLNLRNPYKSNRLVSVRTSDLKTLFSIDLPSSDLVWHFAISSDGTRLLVADGQSVKAFQKRESPK